MKIILLSVISTLQLLSSTTQVLAPIFEGKIEKYQFKIYEGTGIKDVLLSPALKNVLENKEIKKTKKKYFLPLRFNQIKLVTDHPHFNYGSTYGKDVTLYTYNGHQCVILGGYCPKTGKKFLFHFNYNFEDNAKKRELKLYHLLNKFKHKNYSCILTLASGFYSKNVTSVISIVEAVGYTITYCDITPLYIMNPLEPYHNKTFTLFRLKDDFSPTLQNIAKGKKLAILGNGKSVAAANIQNMLLIQHLKHLKLKNTLRKETKKIIKNIQKITQSNIFKFMMKKMKRSLLK